MVDEQEEAKEQNDALKESGKIVPLQKGISWCISIGNMLAGIWFVKLLWDWLASLF